MKHRILFSTLLLMFCCACALDPIDVPITDIPEEASTLPPETPEAPVLEMPSPAIQPDELVEGPSKTRSIATRPAAKPEDYMDMPAPTGEAFGLTGIDAVVFDKVNEYRRLYGIVPAIDLGILLPRLTAEYETDDGRMCYVYEADGVGYFEIGCYPDNWEEPIYEFYEMFHVQTSRFTIDTDENGEYFIADELTMGDHGGDDPYGTLEKIYGPYAENYLARMKQGLWPYPTLREILPRDREALLNTYLQYFFSVTPVKHVYTLNAFMTIK